MNQELQERIPIIGAWKLISFQIKKENGEVVYPFGRNAQGQSFTPSLGAFQRK